MLRNRSYLKAGTLLVLVLLLLAGCSDRQRGTVLHLGHGLDPSHPVHKAMVYMAQRVAELSDGQMRIEIYPSEQLGSERELVELLQIGSLDMTKVSAAVMQGFVPAYEVLGLPYIFVSEAHRYRVLEGPIGRELLLAPRTERLRGLTFYDAGSRSFYTKGHPIREPSDLQGMKIRTQASQTAIQMVNMMGGTATPIAFGELYTALQQGVVDGAENNPPSLYLSHHYEVVGYYSLDQHTAVPDVLLIGMEAWKKLTSQEQQWLQQAANASRAYQKKLWAEASQEALEAVKAAGVEVLRPDKEPFREAVQPMYEAYRDQEDLWRLIQQIRAAADATTDN